MKRGATLLCLVLLAGCASVEAERGFGRVSEETESRIGAKPRWLQSEEDRVAARREAADLLSRPLTADAAVAVTLLQNSRLQAAFAGMGVSAAELAQAGRLPNPGFSFARLTRGAETEIERKVGLNILGVLAMPFALEIEQRRFEQAQLQAAQETLRTAAQVRRAFYEAVAAAQNAAYMAQIGELTGARAELARRLREVGNWSLLNYAREQVFHAEALAQRARAEVAAMVARERLARAMGLWGDQLAFQLPPRLPDLPVEPRAVAEIEREAVAQRLDLRMARAEIDGLARNLGLSRATRFVNVFEVSYLNNRETGKPTQSGYEIELQIPLFDWGDAKVARAEYAYMQAANRLAEIAVDARSEAREAYLSYRAAYDLARHYRDEIVPVRQRIAEEMLLRYNGMISSVFELLADQREQIAAVGAAIEAQRDFWLADTDLAFVTLTGAEGAPRARPRAAAAAPASPGH